MNVDCRLQSSSPSLQLTAPDFEVSFSPLSVCTGFSLWAEVGSMPTTVLASLGLADCPRGGLGNTFEVSLSSVLAHKGFKPPSLTWPSVFPLQQL